MVGENAHKNVQLLDEKPFQASKKLTEGAPTFGMFGMPLAKPGIRLVNEFLKEAPVAYNKARNAGSVAINMSRQQMLNFERGILGAARGQTVGFALDASLNGSPITFEFVRRVEAGMAEGGFATYAKPKLPASAENLTKGQIVEYFQNVEKVPLEQLIADMERIGNTGRDRGVLKLHNPELIKKVGIYKYKYTNPKARGDKIFIEIHKVKGPNDYHHMHISDRFGNLYDKNLNNLTAKFRKENPGWHERKLKREVESLQEAHIRIKEFVELNMEHNLG